ncbi:ABC transporter permease [Bombilactobacillus folatiphilus]|uniref:Transport permease protein n=1 Tax=Bombilactobacillus folatiphilus TaxID=2923362 RepID=A0ABY4P7X3_9LACO|nr:ABC transporter permease [Bombilactobacillus folatiphilus]UQS81808.1 ABC transporter permease [Bombilactobacillus folatiphilus]
MLTIMKQDLRTLLKNKPIMSYLIVYPPLLIILMGFVCSGMFSGDILTSYDYYGVTMIIYLSLATTIILPEMLFGSHVKLANQRIIYTPIARSKVYLAKLLVAISLSYLILAIYLILFNATGLVNFGGKQISYVLLLDLVLVTFSITLGGAFCVLIKSEDLATKLLNILINVFAVLSGLFFPMTIFGKKAAQISNLSPVSKVTNSFFGVIYDHNLGQVTSTIAILLACSIVFLLIIHLLYRPEKFKE